MVFEPQGCRVLPAGGLGVSPNSILTPPQQRGTGVSLPGAWGCPPLYPFPPIRGAGVSLPGVWGCPPIYPHCSLLSAVGAGGPADAHGAAAVLTFVAEPGAAVGAEEELGVYAALASWADL